jgi:hypothetical protein
VTYGRTSSCDTLLKRLAQHLQDVPTELRQLIQKEHPMVRQRHLPGHRDLPPADQPHMERHVMAATEESRGN